MGNVKKFGDVEFWAEHGVVYLSNDKAAAGKDFDSLDDMEKLKIFKGLPPKVFLKRAIVAGTMFLRAGEQSQFSTKEICQFLQDAREVYRRAVEQGAIDSEQADDYKLKHKVYRKAQILVPGSIDSSDIVNEDKIKDRRAQDILLNGF